MASLTTQQLAEKTGKRSVLLVDFTNLETGAQVAKLTDATHLMSGTPLGSIYAPDPGLEVDIPPISGGLNEKAAKVTISRGTTTFADDISNGRAIAPIAVDVYQLIMRGAWRGAEVETLHLHEGRIEDVVRNPGGRAGLIQVQSINSKGQLRMTVGLVAEGSCANVLGDAGCGEPIQEEAAQVTAIDGTTVIVEGLGIRPAGYWHRGSMYDSSGVEILIRAWEGGRRFELSRIPPAIWADNILGQGYQDVTVRSGCSGSVKICSGVWDNEANFLGHGIAMPKHNPVFENPDF